MTITYNHIEFYDYYQNVSCTEIISLLNEGNRNLDDKVEYRYITIAITPKYI